MKKGLVFGLIGGAFLIASCGGGPKVPNTAVQNSGIIFSQREGDNAVILYQKSSTRDAELVAEATRMCAVVGKNPGSRQNMKSNSKIPGVDSRAVFRCL